MKRFDLEEIRRSITERYDWGPSAEWTNFHFRELSKAIEEATGDRLSEETLKRIFGKRKVNSDNYHPQAFSQMALLKFADSLKTSPGRPEKRLPGKSSLKITVRILIGIAGVLILIMLLVLFPDNEENYRFSCDNQEDIYPFTAAFSYDVSEVADSVFIDFGDHQETFLPPEKSMINYFYSNTGIYNVRFYTRSRVLGSLQVTAWSRDWQGGYFPNTQPELFQAFHNQYFYRQPDYFYALPADLKDAGVDLNRKYWTSYRFFSPFGKGLDTLTLETAVENNALTGSLLCYDAGVSLIGEYGLIDLNFTQPKCSRYAGLRVSEKYLDGKFNDLSGLTVDMSDWLKIRLQTENGTFRIFLNEEPVFTETYEKPLGMLLGVVYSFYGSGKIDYLELKDRDNQPFYRNDFSLPANGASGSFQTHSR